MVSLNTSIMDRSRHGIRKVFPVWSGAWASLACSTVLCLHKQHIHVSARCQCSHMLWCCLQEHWEAHAGGSCDGPLPPVHAQRRAPSHHAALTAPQA
jgi:hypothetical protein